MTALTALKLHTCAGDAFNVVHILATLANERSTPTVRQVTANRKVIFKTAIRELLGDGC